MDKGREKKQVLRRRRAKGFYYMRMQGSARAMDYDIEDECDGDLLESPSDFHGCFKDHRGLH